MLSTAIVGIELHFRDFAHAFIPNGGGFQVFDGKDIVQGGFVPGVGI